MAAVAVKNGVYDAIVENAPGGIEFFHGYTWSAHPVACAAASATLKLFRDEDMFARAKALAPKFLERLGALRRHRSEEHTSELQSLMRISYAVFCLKKKTNKHIKYQNE